MSDPTDALTLLAEITSKAQQLSQELAGSGAQIHILQLLVQIMSAELDRLKASVTNNSTVTQSVLTLLTGMAEEIRRLKDDPAALAALADEIDARSAELQKAVTDNTPTPPAPPAPPPAAGTRRP